MARNLSLGGYPEGLVELSVPGGRLLVTVHQECAQAHEGEREQ